MNLKVAREHLERCLSTGVNSKSKKISFRDAWSPEMEEEWEREPYAIWQRLEEETLERKNRPGNPCDHMDGWVGRSFFVREE